MSFDLGAELVDAVRLLVAAALGALIGLEREIHDHPAGMRTHLLVSVGSAGFTVLSIFAFPAPGADPARIAAQIVTGVGFLGAGAILKEGATIRGLTTAASLWAVAAVGMAAGAGRLGRRAGRHDHRRSCRCGRCASSPNGSSGRDQHAIGCASTLFAAGRPGSGGVDGQRARRHPGPSRDDARTVGPATSTSRSSTRDLAATGAALTARSATDGGSIA